jgi:serine phosphatase RsbU (regulator of sigma subunit)
MTRETDPEQRKDLEGELENLREIASRLKPSAGDVPELSGVEIHDLSLPLHGVVGGDHVVYIDFKARYDLHGRIARAERKGRDRVVRNLHKLEHRAGILVVDVSGHRTTDSVIAAMLHQAFLLGARYELDMFGEITTRIFEHINTRFYRTNAVHKYFTMIYGEISEDGTFRFISAGHQPPAVFSREYGKFMKISDDRLVSFPPVGMLPSSADPDERVSSSSLDTYKKRYEVNEINLLASGDILLLYTDGLAEHDESRYFPSEVEELLRGATGASAADICSRLRDDLTSRARPQDDLTVVVIQKKG